MQGMGWDEIKDSGTEPWISDRALEKEVPDERKHAVVLDLTGETNDATKT